MARSKDIRRKKDILTEYKTPVKLCGSLIHKGYRLRPSTLSKARQEEDAYWKQSMKPYQDKGHEDYKWAITEAERNATRLADSICSAFATEFNPKSTFAIESYNVDGRIEGSKSDLIIKEYDTGPGGALISTRHFSLKAYEKDGNIQVCSGTYMSTLLSLAFHKVGVGQYMSAEGKKVPRAVVANIPAIAALFGEDYSVDIAPTLQCIKQLDANFKSLVQDRFPGKEAWKKICRDTAYTAIPLMIKVCEIVKAQDPGAFKDKLLGMCGMDGRDEVVAVAGNKVYSTFGKPKAKEIVNRLNSPACVLNFCQNNQGIKWSFSDKAGPIYSIDMPLTINKNGAWWTEGTVGSAKNIHSKLPGEPREGKRNEIATSTNMWVKPRQIFGE